jgi:hypothetical protein
MFGIGIVVLGVVLLVLVGGVTVLVRWTTRGAPGQPREVAREWRLVLSVRLLALVVGAAAAAATYSTGSHGRGLMLALAAFGGCILLGTALGETLVRPRRDAGVRSASLTPRRVRDYLPLTTGPVAAMVVSTLALLVLTTLTADGGPGLERGIGCTTGSMSSMHTPYPGSYYSLPLVLALVAVLGVAVLAARQVVNRPRGMAPDNSDDDLLRRSSLEVIVAATGCAVGAPLFGICVVAGSALRSLATAQPSCAPGWYPPVGGVLLVVSLVPLVVTLACLVRLALPTWSWPRVPEHVG